MHPSAPTEVAVRLAGLWIYPIKSCAGVAVTEAGLNEYGGLTGDRDWAVINAAGELVWQGGVPKMALVRPELQPDGLLLHAPGVQSLRVKLSDATQACEVKIWHEGLRTFEIFAGNHACPIAEAWFSHFLEQPVRLVRCGEAVHRRRTLNPLHLVTRASLQELKRRLQEQGHPSAPVACFRPNLLIDSPAGELPPFAEENFARLVWSAAGRTTTLQMEAPCPRCIMPNIDLNDATVGQEPLATVSRMSLERRGMRSADFGVYGRGTPGGSLTLGQSGWAVNSV